MELKPEGTLLNVVSALKADVSRPTARKYVAAAQPPNELQAKHSWRTRKDLLVEIWPQAETLLDEASDLEAKALFQYLWERSPWAVCAPNGFIRERITRAKTLERLIRFGIIQAHMQMASERKGRVEDRKDAQPVKPLNALEVEIIDLFV